MRLAVADTGPLHYLVLIGEMEILPKLVGKVPIPPEVRDELDQPQTPDLVRTWVATPPPWLLVQPAPADSPMLAGLERGECASIALAQSLGADALLMDDRAGVKAALATGLAVIGTLGILDRAAQRDLIDLEAAFSRLRATNFRYPPTLLDGLLADYRKGRGLP